MAHALKKLAALGVCAAARPFLCFFLCSREHSYYSSCVWYAFGIATHIVTLDEFRTSTAGNFMLIVLYA